VTRQHAKQNFNRDTGNNSKKLLLNFIRLSWMDCCAVE